MLLTESTEDERYDERRPVASEHGALARMARALLSAAPKQLGSDAMLLTRKAGAKLPCSRTLGPGPKKSPGRGVDRVGRLRQASAHGDEEAKREEVLPRIVQTHACRFRAKSIARSD